jgi:hypothetical protein
MFRILKMMYMCGTNPATALAERGKTDFFAAFSRSRALEKILHNNTEKKPNM